MQELAEAGHRNHKSRRLQILQRQKPNILGQQVPRSTVQVLFFSGEMTRQGRNKQ